VPNIQSRDFQSDKSILAQDFRWARSILKMVRSLLSAYERLCYIHMAMLDIDPTAAVNSFEIKLAPVSILTEKVNQELQDIRLDQVDRLVRMVRDLQVAEGFKVSEWIGYALVKFGKWNRELVEYLLGVDLSNPVLSLDMGGERSSAGGSLAESLLLDIVRSTKRAPVAQAALPESGSLSGVVGEIQRSSCEASEEVE